MGEQPRVVLAVDVGGTLTKVAWARPGGELESDEVRRVTTERDRDGVSVSWLADLIRDRAATRRDLAGFGVVAPGIVDTTAGLIRVASNLGWHDVALREELEQRSGLIGAVGHDVRTAGLAEWRLHHADQTDLLFVAIGTGIAGAPVVDGRMLEAGGYAGEIGHWSVSEAAGLRCACGHAGCLELVASAAGIARQYGLLSGGERAATAREIADLARAGDQAAVDAFARASAALAEAFVRYITLLGPQRIVVGGGLSAASDLLLPSVMAAIQANLSFEREPQVVRAGLGADAGVIGAGVLGWDRVGRINQVGSVQ